MPGAKTTLYEGGMRSPCLVRNPYLKKRGVATDAMVSWVDLAPTILEFANVLDGKGKLNRSTEKSLGITKIKGEQNGRALAPGKFHGRSFLSVLDQEKPRLGSSKRLTYLPRDYDVLPHARSSGKAIQVDLEHRPWPALPFRIGPFGRLLLGKHSGSRE